MWISGWAESVLCLSLETSPTNLVSLVLHDSEVRVSKKWAGQPLLWQHFFSVTVKDFEVFGGTEFLVLPGVGCGQRDVFWVFC